MQTVAGGGGKNFKRYLAFLKQIGLIGCEAA